MQKCVVSMKTSHQIFDVTVEHLLILGPDAGLNNQVPISEYIYHKSFKTEVSFKTDQVM